jgi:hypothetical protein
MRQATLEIYHILNTSKDLKDLEEATNKEIKKIIEDSYYILNVIPSLEGKKLTLNIIYSRELVENNISYKEIILESKIIEPSSKLCLWDENLDEKDPKLSVIKFQRVELDFPRQEKLFC